MKGIARFVFVLILYGFLPFFSANTHAADSPILSKEENYWLSTRNDTIVVYPGKNYPPFSYQSQSGIVQGMCVDYFEIIASTLGIKIHYATPRSQSQIISDMQNGKGDVALSISPSEEAEKIFVFTESIAQVPIVIVARKDADIRKNATMNDFAGKRVAVVEGSLAESFIRENYPRVVLETVSDNEIGLQQTVLAETDAVLMDVASLSFFLSKQVVSSVKIVGNLGIDYEPTFAIPKDKQILQSIIEKGMTQITKDERVMLSEKWATLPGGEEKRSAATSFFEKDTLFVVLYIGVLIAIFFAVLFVVTKRRWRVFSRKKQSQNVEVLVDEMKDLEEMSSVIAEELKEIEMREKEIVEKINQIKD